MKITLKLGGNEKSILGELKKDNLIMTMEMCYHFTLYYKQLTTHLENNRNLLTLSPSKTFLHAHQYHEDQESKYWMVLSRELELLDLNIPKQPLPLPQEISETHQEIITTLQTV